MASVAACLSLLGCTLALALDAALVHASFFAADRLSAWLSLTGYVLAYPRVYMLAAWIFYHGLKPGLRHGADD